MGTRHLGPLGPRVAIVFAVLFLGALLVAPSATYGAEEACEFDPANLEFVGPPLGQAECLLREVRRYARLSESKPLPEPLSKWVGQPMTVDREALRRHLGTLGISEEQVGGSLDDPTSRARNGDPGAPLARYLVIHDTSTPNYGTDDFPVDIDTPAWRYNDLSRWDRGTRSAAHVFIARTGESLTAVDFARPWRATKFELRYGNLDPKGLFLHIELIQPRRSHDAGPSGNDAIAPDPGFTEAQYERLALVYLAASVRRGSWLVPVFHAVLDADFAGGHDDPQRFSLERWARALAKVSAPLFDVSTDEP